MRSNAGDYSYGRALHHRRFLGRSLHSSTERCESGFMCLVYSQTHFDANLGGDYSSPAKVSSIFYTAIGQSVGVWTRRIKQQAHDEHIPNSFLSLGTERGLPEVKRLATLLDRFQYHLASGSNGKWSIRTITLQILNSPSSPPSPPPTLCSPPMLLPGGRYMITAGYDLDSYCCISLWDLHSQDDKVLILHPSSTVFFREHKARPSVSLDIQRSIGSSVNLVASFEDELRCVHD